MLLLGRNNCVGMESKKLARSSAEQEIRMQKIIVLSHQCHWKKKKKKTR